MNAKRLRRRNPRHTRAKTTVMKALLAALAFTALLTPMHVFAMERDGTVLFFSFEDVQKLFSNPTLPQLMSGFAWRDHNEQTSHISPIERNQLQGNGPRIDGQLYPGAGRPLWGY